MWFRKRTEPIGPPKNGPSRSGPSPEELAQASERRAEETVRALSRGQLPEYIRHRIERERRHELPWTSSLSVNEWLVFAQYRLKPLGMVMGSGFFHIGYSLANYAGTWYSVDLGDQERALTEGRRTALDRMVQEAAALGAHAVVSVRLDAKQPGYYGHETEFVAIGTAVVVEGLEPPSRPLVATVSGEDFLKLLQAGSIPVGVALGACVHYQYTSWQDKFQAISFWNTEVPAYTEAIYHTRDRAVRNMWEDARRLGATGVLAHDTELRVLDVEVERGEADEREDHIVEFLAMGTAIATERLSRPLHPELVLELHDWTDR